MKIICVKKPETEGGYVMCKTQKLVFYTALAILASFLFTCKPFVPDDLDESGDEITYTDVVYSQDGKSVTIYLDGAVPISSRQSRALNLRLAQFGHDFFEVAFYHQATNTTARATWETGHAAGVNGVARNVNYASADPGSGAAAILFVGKKSDRTLLAVGSLIGTDDPEGGATFVSANTKSVTFLVAALEAGVRFDDEKADSSFWTNSGAGGGINAGNTIMTEILVGRSMFPLFWLPAPATNVAPAVTVNARYTIKTVAPTVISTYINGIRVAETTPSFSSVAPDYHNHLKTPPQIPLGNGGHEDTSLFYQIESGTRITMATQTAGTAFNNEINFTFQTYYADDGKINAFYFEIPVYPLSAAGNPGKWYIRPGYDSYLKDLDNGRGGTGGAILYGIGDLGDLVYSLQVTKQPVKINYSNHYNYEFDVTGLITYMMVASYRIRKVEISELTFQVGVGRPGGPITLTPGDLLIKTTAPAHNYFTQFGTNGMLIITATFVENGTPYPAEFIVYDGEHTGLNIGDPANILPGNRFILHSWLDLIDLYHAMDTGGTGGTFVIVTYFSMNLVETLHFSQVGNTFIIMAASPDVIIGKGAANGAFQHYSGSNGNNYFLGVWPFNEPFSVDGMALESYPFTINTTGPFEQVNTTTWTAPVTYNSGFIRGQANTSANIVRGGGLRIINDTYFTTGIVVTEINP
jgi:hypothetical protein